MRRHAHGFTLIEVLIALAIVSVALAAGMRVMAVATDDQVRINDRRLAWLCVQDRWTELRLQAVPLENAQWQCTQGHTRFVGTQRITHVGADTTIVQLALSPRHAPHQRVAQMQAPWSPVP